MCAHTGALKSGTDVAGQGGPRRIDTQYCAYDYQKRLQKYGLEPSMSGKGNCYDNAAVESFFKSLQAELLWRQTWPTRRQAEAAIFQYINGFYNARRRHSYLGGISPLAFEAKVA
jgi:putative transposase